MTTVFVTALKRFVRAIRRRRGTSNARVRVHIADVPANPATPSCNICGFVSANEGPRLCPRCGAGQRQRSFRQLFAGTLEEEIFAGGALGDGLLLSPGAVEQILLCTVIRNPVISSLYQEHPAEQRFVRADVRDLTPFTDAAFDYVQASNVLDYVPEMERAIGSIHRVLRPGGMFVLLIPERNLLKGDAPLAVSARTSVTGGYWPEDMRVPFVRVGRETLAAMLQCAGFEPRRIKITEPLSGVACTWWLCRKP